jgi:hypothetical protein
MPRHVTTQSRHHIPSSLLSYPILSYPIPPMPASPPGPRDLQTQGFTKTQKNAEIHRHHARHMGLTTDSPNPKARVTKEREEEKERDALTET